MRAILIDPSFYHNGTLLKFRRVGYFPLTLPRLAACFPPETDLTLIHEKCQEIPWGERFDAAFFTTMGSNLVRAIDISQKFRAMGTKTIVGGFSARPFLALCHESFDSVVLGDAEGVIPRLVDDISRATLQPEYQDFAPAITHLPPPRFNLVPSHIIGDMFPLEASRGCPNSCDFCRLTPKILTDSMSLFQPKHFSPEGLTKAYWNFNTRLLRWRSIVRRFLTPAFLKNPIGYMILLITNFLARDVVARRLPPGMYE